jgi:hypothetical protein
MDEIDLLYVIPQLRDTNQSRIVTANKRKVNLIMLEATFVYRCLRAGSKSSGKQKIPRSLSEKNPEGFLRGVLTSDNHCSTRNLKDE